MLRLRSVALAFLFVGCSSANHTAGDEDPVTDVKQSSVKDQSTDNCWTYATMGWAESLVKRAAGTELNLSESYITYWHWFDQITAGEVTDGEIEEGGSWGEAGDLILKYGVMEEKDFVPGEEKTELSARQESALHEVNAALKSGALRFGADRRNRKLVREVLDKAWGVSPAVKDAFDRTFGADVSKTLEDGARVAAGLPIKRPSALPARLKNPSTHRFDTVTLADAIGTHRSAADPEHRNGPLAWNDVAYPKRGRQARRDFLKRVQRALADGEPVILNWYVDFNALTDDGKFLAPPTEPGSQGGHVVVITDYQAENVPGFGTLSAGIVETRPAALAAALSDQAQVTFFRIKNSWGTSYHPLPSPAPAGLHDVYLNYLNGPIKECDTDDNDDPILRTCVAAIPFESVVLPAGY